MKSREVSTKAILDLYEMEYSVSDIASIVALPEWVINLVIANKDKMGS